MKRKLLSIMATCIVLSIPCITTSADISYSEIYADAVEESCAKHDRMLANGDINQYNYNALGYALSDITGDGLCELIVIQVTNKHDAEYWLYSTDGDSSFYMGFFHCDARTDGSLYGYRQGIIFEEAYKGYVRIGTAEWDGKNITVTTLYEDSKYYDRDATPPTIPELSQFYDSSRLLDEIPKFNTLSYGTRVSRSGSSSASSSSSDGSGKKNLSNYGYRTVNTGGRGSLVFQDSPNGSFINAYQYNDGDQIYVNLDWRQDGYAIAYEDGVYGYVDASYINWGGGSSSGSSSKKNLSNYGYRTVNTGGRGALVFQDSPNGSFMNAYQYNDGDQIYVNLDWRSDGYAIAYEDGVYGYVDASYIDWGGGSSSSSDKKNLSNYVYRTVDTGGRGALVFQSSPNGSFMYDYEYWDGDTIYVNKTWRSDGYAIAYEDGVYGYVDASYIDW